MPDLREDVKPKGPKGGRKGKSGAKCYGAGELSVGPPSAATISLQGITDYQRRQKKRRFMLLTGQLGRRGVKVQDVLHGAS